MEAVLRYAAMLLILSTMVASQLPLPQPQPQPQPLPLPQPQQPPQVAAAVEEAEMAGSKGLRVGFYEKTCPKAETIVQQTIDEEVALHPGLAAGFIRLHFHDCFVRGCDGSVLLNMSMGPDVELTSAGNIGLRGFGAIDAAKAKLEKECPNTVSCADILTFAARDAAVHATFPYYPVPSGRRDGSVSNASEVYGNLPAPFSRDVSAMTSIFAKKGLSTLDLVTLLGAHSMGRPHCKLIVDQVKGVNANSGGGNGTEDALGIDSRYVEHLKKRCPLTADTEAVVSLNPSKVPMNRILTNLYYTNVIKGKAALMSDQALMSDPVTMAKVLEFGKDENLWKEKFRTSMIKMGNIEVLTGTQGQIRKLCGVVNK